MASLNGDYFLCNFRDQKVTEINFKKAKKGPTFIL